MSTAPHQDRKAPARAGRGLRLDRWDLGFLLAVLVILIGSIVPLTASQQNLWNTPGVFYLGVGVVMPLVAGGLVLARGASSGRGPRAGSLSTDQFAHVASWLALAYFFTGFATTLNPMLLIGLLGAIGMVLTSPLRRLTARALTSTQRRSRPAGVEDSVNTTVITTGSTAADVQSGAAAPGATVRFITPAASESAPDDADTARSGTSTVSEHRESEHHLPQTAQLDAGTEDLDANRDTAEDSSRLTLRPAFTRDTEDTEDTDPVVRTGASEAAVEPEPAQYEAFWFAVGSWRMTVDPEDGAPAFGLEPGHWILALEDRGDEFLVQNADGRTGVLRDLSDIERA